MPLPGHSNADEKKRDVKLFCAIMIPLGVLIFLTQFVFDNQWQDATAQAGTIWNILGIVCHLVSMGSLLFSYKLAGGDKSHPGLWLWFGFLVAGAMTSIPGGM